MKHTEQFSNLNKKKIGRWALNDQRRIRQLEDELMSFSCKTCNLVLQGKGSSIRYETVYNKVTEIQAKIYAIKLKYGVYQDIGE